MPIPDPVLVDGFEVRFFVQKESREEAEGQRRTFRSHKDAWAYASDVLDLRPNLVAAEVWQVSFLGFRGNHPVEVTVL